MLIQFLNSHSDNIILDLNKIYNEIETYEPSLKKDLGYNVFKTQLNVLQNDLIIHSKIEDEIYVEKVLKKISQHNHLTKVNNS